MSFEKDINIMSKKSNFIVDVNYMFSYKLSQKEKKKVKRNPWKT